MKITLLSSRDYKESVWSGGKTTEIFLSPSFGDFQQRKFDYRISTASVSQQESEFSMFKGFQRIIMSLDAPLELTHKKYEEIKTVHLKPLESWHFSGSDETISIGKCQDFNVIYNAKYQATMTVVKVPEKRVIPNDMTIFYYALAECVVIIDDQKYRLKQNDTLQISEVKEPNKMIQLVENSPLQEQPLHAVIEVRIWK